MNVNVKLMNMELWVTDYENQPQELAQILQLEFQSDLFYESEQFGKDISCSPNPDKAQKKQLGLSGVDPKGCHTSERIHEITKGHVNDLHSNKPSGSVASSGNELK